MYAFISYQTNDKHVAGKIKGILSGIGIDGFLAHEDITVSEEWRLKILEEIGKADIFISILSNDYHQSPWCIQESGIAAFRTDVTPIPLSIDGSIPQGFSSNIQSTKIDPDNPTLESLIPGIAKHDISSAADILIKIVARSGSYRGAESNFKRILPYLQRFPNEQMKQLLETVASNDQVHHAGLCASEYIPPLLESYGHLLGPDTLAFLKGICKQYA